MVLISNDLYSSIKRMREEREGFFFSDQIHIQAQHIRTTYTYKYILNEF